MRAAFYEQLGPARDVLQVGDIPLPEPAPGEVRVRVDWSGINPSDVKTRMGRRVKEMPFPRVIPHSDGAGVIDAVGEGVRHTRLGERVWVWNAARGRPHGTACEFLCLPVEQAVILPEQTSSEAGACLGIPALTALHSVLMDEGVAGKTVMVAGGAGAVGHYAVQFASLLGATRVIASASTPQKADLAYQAGADHVVLYKSEPLAERVLDITQGQGVDRVIEVDISANAAANLQMLKTGGECVIYGSGIDKLELPFSQLLQRNIQLKFFIVYHLSPRDRARAVATLTRMLERGVLKHNIAARLDLEEIVTAHEIIERGQMAGNVVLRVGR